MDGDPVDLRLLWELTDGPAGGVRDHIAAFDIPLDVLQGICIQEWQDLQIWGMFYV